ncbi:hypothetical protein [Actinomyces faecalis]|uniref:hypothetical protein n=1 Tax=Actinomyces faecalis TaxID=2722820 RepID=UPI0015575C47|nr:hypothetical protein [Actinomyces faecalis]
MDLVTVHDTVTGARLEALPASGWSWRRQVSGAGALEVTVPWSRGLAGRSLREELAPWRTTLAVTDTASRRVVAAGVVYARRWDADTQTLKVSCEDLWALLKRRLVLSPALDSYSGGQVAGRDGTYPPPWTVHMSGTLPSIARDLVGLALSAGTLPVVLPQKQAGGSVRTYLGPDLATVADRLEDLTGVIDGPEIVFDPRLADGGTSLSWHMLTGSPELVSGEHSWDARRRAVPLIDLSVEEDASDMVGDSWARGGSQDDQTLIAHHHDRWLEGRGWPLLQAADTSHSTVSDLTTLAGWARTPTVVRARSTEVVSLRARRTDESGYALGDAVLPGDHVRLRHDDPYLGSGTIVLKVLETSGDEGEWVTCSCREVVAEGVA